MLWSSRKVRTKGIGPYKILWLCYKIFHLSKLCHTPQTVFLQAIGWIYNKRMDIIADHKYNLDIHKGCVSSVPEQKIPFHHGLIGRFLLP